MGDPSQQVHDFNPGIAPSGLFWTIPIEPGAIKVNPVTGEARLRVQALKIEDFHDFLTSIGLTVNPLQQAYGFNFELTPRLSPNIRIGSTSTVNRFDPRFAPTQ